MDLQTSIAAIEIQTPAGLCDAWLARPKNQSKYPGVLVLMDGFGPRDYLFQMIRKLASNGFVVLLPNLLYRQKRAPIVSLKFPLRAEDLPEARNEMLPLVRGYDPEAGLSDIEVFMNFIRAQDDCNGRIAVTGYCMGGSLSIRAAARYPDQIYAAASFHGGNLATELPESPHLLLPLIKAKIYVAHADNDGSMPPEQIERFKAAVAKAPLHAEVELYDGAAHGFTMEDLPAFNASALARHWSKLLEVLKI